MPITNLDRDYGVQPSIVRMTTTDDLGTITASNYLIEQQPFIALIKGGSFTFVNSDVVCIYYQGGHGFFELSDDFSTLVKISGGSSLIIDGTPNEIDVNTVGDVVTLSISSTLVVPPGATATSPSASNNVATKGYVDAVAGAGGLTCYAASAGILTGYVYNNGASGIGATLTAPSDGVFVLDGITVPVNQPILYKQNDDGGGIYNGIYIVTSAGSVSAPAILTRASYYDTPSQINGSSLIPIQNGNTNAGTAWLNSSIISSVGSDPIIFISFGLPSGVLSPSLGGTGIDNATNTLTINADSIIDQDVSTAGNPDFASAIIGGLTLSGTSILASGAHLFLNSTSGITQIGNFLEPAIPTFFQVCIVDQQADIAIGTFSNSANLAPNFDFIKSRSTVGGTRVTVQNGDELGVMQWFADDGIDLTNLAASMVLNVQGTVSTGLVPAVLIFSTCNETTGIQEVMNLDSNQNLNLSNPLSTSSGGLGLINPTVHGLLVGEGSSPVNSLVLGAGQILVGTTSGDPAITAINSGQNILVSNGSGTITVGFTGILPIASGGTNVSSVTIAPTASSFAGWDANSNLSANNFLPKIQPIVTAGATTILTNASAYSTQFTGTLDQTVQFPVVTTFSLPGASFQIINDSSGTVTVTSSGGNTIQVLSPNTTAIITNTLGTGTTDASWSSNYSASSSLILPLSPDQGGTGIATPALGSILIAQGSDPMDLIILAPGELLIGTGTVPAASTLNSGSNISISNGVGTIEIDTIADPIFNSVTGGNVLISDNILTTTGGDLLIAPTVGNTIVGSIVPNVALAKLLVADIIQAIFAVGSFVNDVATDEPIIEFVKSRSSNPNTRAAVENGDSLGDLNWVADDGTTLTNISASISVLVGDNVSTGIVPGSLFFSTTNTSGVLEPAIIISDSQIVTLANPLEVDSGGLGLNTTVNQSVLTADDSGNPVWIALTDGQFIIGSTSGSPAAANITAGTGINIANSSNGVTISTTGASGLAVVAVSGTTQVAAVDTVYYCQNSALTTITLPTTFALGDVIGVKGVGAGGWILVAATGDVINVGNSVTSSGGSVASSNQYDTIFISGIVANTQWSMDNAVTNEFTLS